MNASSIAIAAAAAAPATSLVQLDPAAPLCDQPCEQFRVGPVLKTSPRGLSQFDHADFAAVTIVSAVLPYRCARAADFTRAYGTFAFVGPDAYTLLFKLQEHVRSETVYRKLTAGLQTLYAGSVDELRTFPAAVSSVEVLCSRLDQAATRHLMQLGSESLELKRSSGAFLRSKINVERDTLIDLATGVRETLGRIPRGLEVHCPIHTDVQPTATVHAFTDGTLGIQCRHCRRTYAAPSTRRQYEFGEFDEVIKDLSTTTTMVEIRDGVLYESNPITYLAEQYLPRLELTDGATFIKSPKGSGKSEFLTSVVADCKKRNQPVLLLGNRRALMSASAARLGLTAYFAYDLDAAPKTSSTKALHDVAGFAEQTVSADLETNGIARYERVAPAKHYAVCLDSLMNLDPTVDRYPVVIIDESEQVFAHLTGSTLKSQRREVFFMLRHYLRNAEKVICLDADLGMITMQACFATLKDETPASFVINQPSAKAGAIHVYSSREHVTAELAARIDRGRKVFVTTNSKRKAVDLSKTLAKQFPRARIMLVTSENSQEQNVQIFLQDIAARFEEDIDVLIASPAIGTGIDISFRNREGTPRVVVDDVFGLFEGNITTHFDADQQLMRVRQPGAVHVWIDQRPLNYEVDVECIRRELERSILRTTFLLGIDDDGKFIFQNDAGLIDIWARVEAAARGSKNRLASLFQSLRAENGWELHCVEEDNATTARGKELLVEGKAIRKAEEASRIMAAERLTFNEASALEVKSRKGISLTQSDRDALERYWLEHFYDEEATEELIAFDDEGRTRQSVRRLEFLTSSRDWLEVLDTAERHSDLVAFDRRLALQQRHVLGMLFGAAGIFHLQTSTFRTDASIEKAGLGAFLRALEAAGKQVESLFKVPLNTDRQRNPVGQLRTLLRLVGMVLKETSVKQQHGLKTRSHGLDFDRHRELMEIVSKRDARRDNSVARKGEDTLHG